MKNVCFFQMKIAHMDPALGQEKAKESQALRNLWVGSDESDGVDARSKYRGVP